MEPVPVKKEELHLYRPSQREVLEEITLKEQRENNLFRAMILGNRFKQKVRIFFKCNESKNHELETTVWSVSDRYVELKGSKMLPINSIYDVKY